MTQEEEKLILKGIIVKLTIVLKFTMRQSRRKCLKHQWVGVQLNKKTNTNNKSRSINIPAPKVATQQKRDSLVATSERKAKNFPIRSTASTSQNVTERRYQARSTSGITRPRKLKDYFLLKDNDSDEKFDKDVFFFKKR